MCLRIQLPTSRVVSAPRALGINTGLGAIARCNVICRDHGRVGADVVLALLAAGRGDEGVVPARHDKAGQDEDQGDMANAKAEDMQGVLAQLVKGRVGEAVDNGEDRGGDVTDERRPKGRDPPVLALSYYYVEVAAELVALDCENGLVIGDRVIIGRGKRTE